MADKENGNFHYEGGEARADELKDFGGDFFSAFCLTMKDPLAVRKISDGDGDNPGEDGGGVIFKMKDIIAEVINGKIGDSRDDTPKNIGNDVEVGLKVFLV